VPRIVGRGSSSTIVTKARLVVNRMLVEAENWNRESLVPLKTRHLRRPHGDIRRRDPGREKEGAAHCGVVLSGGCGAILRGVGDHDVGRRRASEADGEVGVSGPALAFADGDVRHGHHGSAIGGIRASLELLEIRATIGIRVAVWTWLRLPK